MTRLLAILTLLLAAPALADARYEAARLDYVAIKALGNDDYLHVRYLIADPDESIEAPVNWERAARFYLPSCSLETSLNLQLPVKIVPGCWRIDLRGYGWDPADLIEILRLEGYPYSHDPNPLCIRLDWLLYKASDTSESPAYEILLFGKDGRPKNRDEWLQKLGVDRKAVEALKLNHGLIEGKSGVAVQSGAEGDKVRILESFDRYGGYAWGTRDFLKLTADNSPVEKPDFAGIKHDGEEWIVGVAKSWSIDPAYGIASSGRGALQVYFLSNGQGGNVTEAPSKLVEDHSRFKGVSSIRTPGSCVSCHTEGLKRPTENVIESLIRDGVELKAKDYASREFIERFHLGGVSREIDRANEDFAATIEAACGCKPAEAIAALVAANDFYRADVTLDVAAMEHGCKPDEIRNAIAYASEKGVDVGAAVARLAHGHPMNRVVYEGEYLDLDGYLHDWRAR